MCKNVTRGTFRGHAVVQRPSFFSRAFGCGARKGKCRYITTLVRIPTEPRGGALSIQRRRTDSFFKGLRSASLSRVGEWKTPHYLCFF